MNIIKNGTPVTLCNGDIKGTVIGCCIRGIEPNMRFEYEVSWFVSGTKHSSWVESYEIEEFVETKRKAGMVNYERSLTI